MTPEHGEINEAKDKEYYQEKKDKKINTIAEREIEGKREGGREILRKASKNHRA